MTSLSIHKKKFTVFLICFFVLSPFYHANAQEESGKIVVETIDRGFGILDNPAYQHPDQYSERRQKLWEIIEPVFYFEEMSKRVLGRHWKEITPQQQKDFSDLFTDILKDAYLGKSDKYNKQKFAYLKETIEGNRSRVETQVTTDDGKMASVDLLMLKAGNSWKVYDIIIEGVSMVGNYRSQFDSILAKSTFDELMQKMKDKHKELSEI